jgi:hypothetical protein
MFLDSPFSMIDVHTIAHVLAIRMLTTNTGIVDTLVCNSRHTSRFASIYVSEVIDTSVSKSYGEAKEPRNVKWVE